MIVSQQDGYDAAGPATVFNSLRVSEPRFKMSALESGDFRRLRPPFPEEIRIKCVKAGYDKIYANPA